MLHFHERAAPPPSEDSSEFVLSDATVDRAGDVIEPGGWDLTNFRKSPIALFNHDRNQVIGKWVEVGVRGAQLVGRLQLAEQGTSPLVDSIRKLVAQGILRTVSVGFRALKREKLREDSDEMFGPFRFLKSELMECSLVSVPANPNALAIAKDFPRELIAEVFRKPAFEGLDAVPRMNGKSAAVKPQSKAQPMSTLSQRIQTAEKRVLDLRDKLTELAGRDDLNDEQREQSDTLPDLIEAEEKELHKWRRQEQMLAPRPAQPQPPKTPLAEELPATEYRSFVMPKKKIEPVDLQFQTAAIIVKSAINREPFDKTMVEMYGKNEALGHVLKAAILPAQTTVAGWASELVNTAQGGFMDRILIDSLYRPLAARGQRFDLGRNGTIRIPTRSATPRVSGQWVGEGAPKPVKRIGLSSVPLTPHKIAVITTFTEEMALYSTPAIEELLRQAMINDTSESLDAYLIDNVAASTTRPAGLLNGVSAITASAATPASAAMVADLKALVGAIITAGGGERIVIIMNPAQALSIGVMQTTTGDFMFEGTDQAGTRFMAEIIVSRNVAAGTVIAIDAANFATVTGDTPRFAMSNEATLHMEDTTPLQLGTGTQGAGVLAVPMQSMFQTDTLALRLSIYVTWGMLRTGMVQTITGITAW